MSTEFEPSGPDRRSSGSGESPSQVARDQDDRADPSDASWGGGQFVKDQDSQETAEPERDTGGWSGSEVVKDQDHEPDDPETGWNSDQIVTDLGTDHPER